MTCNKSTTSWTEKVKMENHSYTIEIYFLYNFSILHSPLQEKGGYFRNLHKWSMKEIYFSSVSQGFFLFPLCMKTELPFLIKKKKIIIEAGCSQKFNNNKMQKCNYLPQPNETVNIQTLILCKLFLSLLYLTFTSFSTYTYILPSILLIFNLFLFCFWALNSMLWVVIFLSHFLNSQRAQHL